MYLESLRRFGLDLLEHDIRFVEDDWELHPGRLGAGLGGLVDGMETTQFTYLRAAGRFVSLGRSRWRSPWAWSGSPYLQKVDSVYDIAWNETVTYGQIFHQAEKEFSAFNFEEANVADLTAAFDTWEREAQTDRKRPDPAGLRLLPEVLAHLQPARRPRHQRCRADPTSAASATSPARWRSAMSSSAKPWATRCSPEIRGRTRPVPIQRHNEAGSVRPRLFCRRQPGRTQKQGAAGGNGDGRAGIGGAGGKRLSGGESVE